MERKCHSCTISNCHVGRAHSHWCIFVERMQGTKCHAKSCWHCKVMSSKYLLPRAQGLVRGTWCVCTYSRTQMGWDRPPKCQMRGTGRRGLGVQRETGVCGPVSPQSLWGRCCHCVTPHSGAVFQWQVSDACSCVPL